MAIFSKRALEGYLLIDHRNAPGAGLVPGGATYESATITCSHCHRIVVLNPDRSRPRNHCVKCDHYICDGCAVTYYTTGVCTPLNALIEQEQERAVTAITAGG